MALGDVLFRLRSRFDSTGVESAQKGLAAVTRVLGPLASGFKAVGAAAGAAGVALKVLIAIKVAGWLNDIARAGEEAAGVLQDFEYRTGLLGAELLVAQRNMSLTGDQAELFRKALLGNVAATRELDDTSKAFRSTLDGLGLSASKFAALPIDDKMRLIEKGAFGARGEVANLKAELDDINDVNEDKAAGAWDKFWEGQKQRFAAAKDDLTDIGGGWGEALLDGIAEAFDPSGDPDTSDDWIARLLGLRGATGAKNHGELTGRQFRDGFRDSIIEWSEEEEEAERFQAMVDKWKERLLDAEGGVPAIIEEMRREWDRNHGQAKAAFDRIEKDYGVVLDDMTKDQAEWVAAMAAMQAGLEQQFRDSARAIRLAFLQEYRETLAGLRAESMVTPTTPSPTQLAATGDPREIDPDEVPLGPGIIPVIRVQNFEDQLGHTRTGLGNYAPDPEDAADAESNRPIDPNTGRPR